MKKKTKSIPHSEESPAAPVTSASSFQASPDNRRKEKVGDSPKKSIRLFHAYILEQQLRTEKVFEILTHCIRQNIPSFDGYPLKEILQQAPDELLYLLEYSLIPDPRKVDNTQSAPLPSDRKEIPQQCCPFLKCISQKNRPCCPPDKEYSSVPENLNKEDL